MKLKTGKITFDRIFSVLIILFIIAFFYSARVKSWVIMGLMMVGFFKPDIPQHSAADQLLPAPAMIVHTLNGSTVDLQQQKGKVVFINFWATWCPPCRAELPAINNLYLKVKDNPNIVFLSVDVDDNLPVSSKFLQNDGYGFPVYGGSLVLPHEVYTGNIPTTLVIDKKGFVVFNHINRANYADEKFVNYLIGLSKQ